MGTLPKTRYLLVCHGMVKGEFNSKFNVAFHLGISIDDDGSITFMENPVHPTYDLGKEGRKFSKTEALMDWSRCYLEKNLPRGYVLYRFLV